MVWNLDRILGVLNENFLYLVFIGPCIIAIVEELDSQMPNRQRLFMNTQNTSHQTHHYTP